jgi:hypothetical protein
MPGKELIANVANKPFRAIVRLIFSREQSNMTMPDTNAQYRAWNDLSPRVIAFRGRMGFAVAVMFFCVASTLPATANGQSLSRSNATWHTVKASQVSENGTHEDIELEENAARPPVHGPAASKLFFPASPTTLGNLAGALAVHPLRSPPRN